MIKFLYLVCIVFTVIFDCMFKRRFHRGNNNNNKNVACSFQRSNMQHAGVKCLRCLWHAACSIAYCLLQNQFHYFNKMKPVRNTMAEQTIAAAAQLYALVRKGNIVGGQGNYLLATLLTQTEFMDKLQSVDLYLFKNLFISRCYKNQKRALNA